MSGHKSESSSSIDDGRDSIRLTDEDGPTFGNLIVGNSVLDKKRLRHQQHRLADQLRESAHGGYSKPRGVAQRKASGSCGGADR